MYSASFLLSNLHSKKTCVSKMKDVKMPFSVEWKRICMKDWAKAEKHNPPTIFLPHQPNPFLGFQRLLMGCANASRV